MPFDIGTSNRSGARFGPRQIRAESCLIRPYNMATRAAPFDSLSVADIGDVAINTFNLEKSIAIIEAAYDEILSHNCIPMTIGGDHTIALPILRALKRKYGPVGMVHIDAHADVNDSMFGEPIAHGTPFRRAVEEGLLDGKRVAQIGLRATGYSAEDFDWPRSQGFRVVQAEECWYKSLAPLMREIKEQVKGGPVYLSFDIDGLDPSCAPGTGTPEIGGLTTTRAWRSSAAASACSWSAATWSRSRRPTTPAATPRCSRPTCCSRCCACCRASNTGTSSLLSWGRLDGLIRRRRCGYLSVNASPDAGLAQR